MTERESEDAQAERECASVALNDDPQPGACYGLPVPETDPDPTYAEHQ